jgi:hypothetical protein
VTQELEVIAVGDRIMDHWAVGLLVKWAAGGKQSTETRESLRQEISRVAAELAGPNPTPIERMLAEVAAVDWFALRLHEARYASASSSQEGITLVQGEHCQRRIDRTHRRFLQTVKTLAMVRKMALPSLQVNIGANQVNVTG